MKKIFTTIAAVAIAAFAFSATAQTLKPIDFTSNKAGEDVRQVWAKFLDPRTTVFEMTFRPANVQYDFTKVMDVFTITYLEPNSTEVKKLSINLDESQEATQVTPDYAMRSKTASDGLILDEISLTLIPNNIRKAAGVMRDDYDCPLDGIAEYAISFGSTASKTVHTFSLESIDPEDTDEDETSYYGFNFSADFRGNVTELED